MNITTDNIDTVTVVRLSGDLDTNTSELALGTLTELIDGGSTKVLVNFADVGFVSSAGLRVLLATAKKIKAANGTFKICGLNETVQEVFDISGFSTILSVAGSEEEALALGDPFPAAREVPPSSLESLRHQFGGRFVEGLKSAAVSHWSAPIPSTYGAHIIKVRSRLPERLKTFSEARSEVLQRLMLARKDAARLRLVGELLEKYQVVMEGFEPAELVTGAVRS